MGNYRFKLSDMMPNAWFYKLKDMSKTKNHNIISQPTNKNRNIISQQPRLSQPRKSYYYTSDKFNKLHNSPPDTQFPPRRSTKRKTKRKTVYKPSSVRTTSSRSASDRSSHASVNPFCVEPEEIQAQNYSESSSTESFPEFDLIKSSSSEPESNNFDPPPTYSRSSSCSCRFKSSDTDIIIDVTETSYTKKMEKFDNFSTVSELELPPIRTKLVKSNDPPRAPRHKKSSSDLEKPQSGNLLSIKIIKEESNKTRKESAPRKSISQSTGVKIRGNSPKLASKRSLSTQTRKNTASTNKRDSRKRNVSESFAIVKASFDPEKDFKDSMMEMIVENNIRSSKDLEQLLASYLSLNSDEYHNLIVKAFEQIWFSMPEIQM